MKNSVSFDELGHLARQVLGGGVHTGAIGGEDCWSWNWYEQQINVNLDDLQKHPGDVCRAVLLHECAHAAITRVHQVARPNEMQSYFLLLNVLEDIRIERWLEKALPGCAPWLRLANSSIRPRGGWDAKCSHTIQFMRLIMDSFLTRDEAVEKKPLPSPVESVAECFATACGAIEEIATCLPPAIVNRAASVDIEREQRKMLHIARKQIFPLWDSVLHDDPLAGEFEIFDPAGVYQRLLAESPTKNIPREGVRGVGLRAVASRTLATQVLSQQGAKNGLKIPESYDSRRQALTPEIAKLQQSLKRILHLHGDRRWQYGVETGRTLHLPSCMQADADPRRTLRVWQRRAAPWRFRPTIGILCDTSSSMKKCRTAPLDGFVLLSSVCQALGFSFGCWSFNDKIGQVLPLAPRHAPGEIAQAGVTLRTLRGNTEMGDALNFLLSREKLHQQTAPILFVISDGMPRHKNEVIQARHRLESLGVTCIGLGLGKNTEQIAEIFPHSEGQINADGLADAVARLLLQALPGNGLFRR